MPGKVLPAVNGNHLAGDRWRLEQVTKRCGNIGFGGAAMEQGSGAFAGEVLGGLVD